MKKQINGPSIIFSRFNEDSSWKSKKFKELLNPTEGIRRGPFGSALKKEIFVQNSEYVVYEQQNAIYDHFNTRYRISEEKYHELKKFILSPGDFIMSGAGTIGKISLVPEGIENGVFNQALIRLRVNKNTDKEFFLQWMRSPEMQNKLTKANPASAMVNLVPMSEVKEWDVIIPSPDEQSAIGSLFRTLDDLLASYKDNLANYQSLKATMLSKMFPKAGQKVPEIRLDGHEGEWEIKRADEIFKSVSEKNRASLPVLSASQIDGMVLRDEIGIDIKYDEATLNNYKVVKPGQFVIHLRSFQGGFALSKLEGITSPAYTVIDFIDKSNNLSDFWNSILTSRDFIKRLETVTYGIRDGKSISFKDFSSLKFVFPNLEEQQAIGSYFSNLDNLINSHQEKISQLETLKKRLLQDMFI